MDFVDPHYDFLNDRNGEGRQLYWGDQYPHEILGYAPYDGILVSRGIVGDHKFSGKYSPAQAMRFRRVGARTFLRFNGAKYADKWVFGDCGAFSYVKMEVPPYSSEEIVEFYADGQFTHGCSVDHVIFEFDRALQGMAGGSEDAHRRFEITVNNAESFLKASRTLGPSFTPVGVVQGWSPGSMAEGARRLERLGYRYLALGGMVPLSADSIHACLQEIRRTISPDVGLHILGFAKAEQIGQFQRYGIASFDSTSPLLRAFKDSRANYYALGDDGTLDYYSAIRIPQSIENPRLLRAVKEGRYKQEHLTELERAALKGVREYDVGRSSISAVLEALTQYSRLFISDQKRTEDENEKTLRELLERTERTLRDRPWKRCGCAICGKISVEVMIFRGNNRNRRRGFHNLGVYFEHLRRHTNTHFYDDQLHLPSRPSSAERIA
jgi:hypothetical protein